MIKLTITLTGDAERIFKEMVQRFACLSLEDIEHQVVMDAFGVYDRVCEDCKAGNSICSYNKKDGQLECFSTELLDSLRPD